MSNPGLMNKLNMVLKEHDFELWQDFEDKQMHPQFYSLRWLTLLLSQEFELPDVLRLWDSLFADAERFQFLLYFCCAMIVSLREELLDGTFADNTAGRLSKSSNQLVVGTGTGSTPQLSLSPNPLPNSTINV